MQVFYEAVLTAEEWNVRNVDTNEFVYETTRKDRSRMLPTSCCLTRSIVARTLNPSRDRDQKVQNHISNVNAVVTQSWHVPLMTNTSPLALLLEDEGLIALDLEYSLQSAGFNVTTLASRLAAEEWLGQNEPRFAIIDVVLQDGSSHRIAEVLAERGIPFLVHSGDMAHMHAETPFGKGEWMSKPAKSTDIIEWATRASKIGSDQDHSVSSPGS